MDKVIIYVSFLRWNSFPPQGDPLHREYPDHDPGGAAAGSVPEVQELQRGLCAYTVIFVFWQRENNGLALKGETSHLVLHDFNFT